MRAVRLQFLTRNDVVADESVVEPSTVEYTGTEIALDVYG